MPFLKRTWLNRFLGAILIVVLLAPSFYFSLPKKAEAQWPVFDIPTEVSTAVQAISGVTQTTKDLGLDSIAWVAAKMIIRKITAQTVNWINSGFQGSPAYITDPNQFFLNVGDQMAGRALSATSLNKLCTPFQAKVRIALVKNYLAETDPSYYSNTCTLGRIEQNFENFTNDFSYGGWDAFFQVTQNTQNNPYGAYMDTKNQMYVSIGNQTNKYQKQLEWGKGILSYERCKPGTEYQPMSETEADLDGAFDVDKVDFGIPAGGCTPENKETVTPGTVIEGQMQNVFGSNIKQLEMADEINEIISALLNQLTDALIGGVGKGLRGLTQKSSTNSRTYLEQISQGSPETILEDNQASTTISEGVEEFKQQAQEAGDSASQSAGGAGTPILVLEGESPMYVSIGTIFTDPGATAVDPVTKTRSTVTSPEAESISTKPSGTYYLDYSFTGSSGETVTVQRTVIVQ